MNLTSFWSNGVIIFFLVRHIIINGSMGSQLGGERVECIEPNNVK